MSHPSQTSAVILAMLATAACGPKTAQPPPPTPVDAAPRPATEDITAEMKKVTVTGVAFKPSAIVPPPMVLVRPDRKIALDKQRATWKKVLANPKASLDDRQTQAQILATLLWDAAKTRPDDRAALISEARAALDAAHAAAAGKSDSTTLEMGAAMANAAGDRAGAMPYQKELIERFPSEPSVPGARVQLAFAQLLAGDDAGATATVAGAQPDKDAPTLAYVIAWTRYRARDLPGASAAIAQAILGWQDDTHKEITRDFLIMTARAGTAPADAAKTIAALDGSYAEMTYKLSQSYSFAARPDLASAALDLVLAAGGAPEDALVERLEQAEYARRNGDIDKLPAAWQAAKAAFDACTVPACADKKKLFGDSLAARAVEMHTVFATTGDMGYHAAAKAMYEIFATLPDRADADSIGKYAKQFAATTPPESGAQYADAVLSPLSAHLQEIQACYEESLQGAPTLAGALTLKLELDQHGAVTGATTDPAGGDSGLAVIAGCVEQRARAWRLPARPRPGVARVTAAYDLVAPSSSP